MVAELSSSNHHPEWEPPFSSPFLLQYNHNYVKLRVCVIPRLDEWSTEAKRRSQGDTDAVDQKKLVDL